MKDKPLKIMYLTPVGVDSLDVLFEDMVKDTKDPNTEIHITSLKDKSLRKLIFKDTNEVKEEIIFKNKIGRIRDIQIQPGTGKLFFLSDEGYLWKMEK